MLRIDGPGRLVGPKRGVPQLRVFPMCPECLAREQEEPGFLISAFQVLTRSRLYAIRGQGEGDGIGKGLLRLVPASGDDEGETDD